MEFPGTGNEHALDVELPGSDHRDFVRARSRSDRSSSPTTRAPCVDRFEDRGRPRTSATVRWLFLSPQGRRQQVAVDEAWSYGRPATFAVPGFGGISATAPGPTLYKEDVDMGQNDVHLHNAPALPKNLTFKGSTKEERRVFMAAYNLYTGQTNALTANGVRPFTMPDPDDVSKGEWIAWFKQGYDVDPRALDTLKKPIKSAVVFDTSVPDADSQIGRMLDGLAAAIRRDRQEWVIREESQAIVKIITDAVKPASLHLTVTEQMALTRNKPLKKDLYRFVRWLREYAIGHERFVGYEEELKPPTDVPDAKRPELPAIVDGVLPVQASLLDSGADLSVVSEGLVSALLAAGASPEITVMGPMELRPYGADSQVITVTK
ncbi:hypothetical protein DYB28_009044 [Aphanomyces astaci]|uniref:Peptidase A2 domain-containing protein n=1 Tax=Aphanomyces astaci TaxID=112090 RepID=A0A9X8EE67_APHAT|nr:hypothetical protein DYB28_009044 [Aphanomyces astaci]